jgi:hypothetical protein
LENTAYAGTYLAPQSEGIISDQPIGINLNGRREGFDYSSIVAWDDPAYAYSGLKVEIAYDPLNIQTIEVRHGKLDVVHAHPVQIGPHASKTPVLPAGMAEKKPETSRFLDALEKKYREDHKMMANALSFGDYGKAGE